MDYPTIQVTTLYPGASPDVVTSAITAPLERQFGQMSGLKQMSSRSGGGASVVTLQFQLTLPLDVAEQEVQAAINAAIGPAQSASVQQSESCRSADHDPRGYLHRAANGTGAGHGRDAHGTKNLLGVRRRAGDAVWRSTSSGACQAECALGLSSETVRTAITSANVNSAKGSLDGPERAITLSANDQMQSIDAYRKLIIAYQNGRQFALAISPPLSRGRKTSSLVPGLTSNQRS